ncbi:hypothetical protein CLAIMM_05331, partial [Cladophialophora immunda]
PREGSWAGLSSKNSMEDAGRNERAACRTQDQIDHTSAWGVRLFPCWRHGRLMRGVSFNGIAFEILVGPAANVAQIPPPTPPSNFFIRAFFMQLKMVCDFTSADLVMTDELLDFSDPMPPNFLPMLASVLCFLSL